MPNTEQSIENTGGVPEIEFEMEVSGMTQTAVDRTLSIADMAADAKATGDAIQGVAEDLADLAADVATMDEKTGEDIPLSSAPGAPSIAEAVGDYYPVGSVYVTAADELPAVIAAMGTWIEVAIPLTWGDIKRGSRSYTETGGEFTPGNLHFWLRTA